MSGATATEWGKHVADLEVRTEREWLGGWAQSTRCSLTPQTPPNLSNASPPPPSTKQAALVDEAVASEAASAEARRAAAARAAAAAASARAAAAEADAAAAEAAYGEAVEEGRVRLSAWVRGERGERGTGKRGCMKPRRSPNPHRTQPRHRRHCGRHAARYDRLHRC